MPLSSLEVNSRFGGTCAFRLQGRRIGQAKNNFEETRKMSRRENLVKVSKIYDEGSRLNIFAFLRADCTSLF
jgi:hypothetical protein